MEHYYSEKQTSRLRITEIEPNLRGNLIKLNTGSGVFSIGNIDKGTKLLIENCIVEQDWKILDLGCGYGPIGISLAKALPQSKVLMTDINERAVRLARDNIRLNNIENASAIKSNLYDKIEGKFNTIIANPPQFAGRDICYEIIEKAKDHLEKDGLLQLVARHNKGGKQLEKKMNEVFGNAKDITKKSGYRVYVSRLP